MKEILVVGWVSINVCIMWLAHWALMNGEGNWWMLSYGCVGAFILHGWLVLRYFEKTR